MRRAESGHRAMMNLVLKDEALRRMAQTSLRKVLKSSGGLVRAARELGVSSPQAIHPLMELLEIDPEEFSAYVSQPFTAPPPGWADSLPKNRSGPKRAEPTTPDGEFVESACKRMGITVAALAETIGADQSVLCRARKGVLPRRHRDAIETLLKVKAHA
jgi:hypothetical protein